MRMDILIKRFNEIDQRHKDKKKSPSDNLILEKKKSQKPIVEKKKRHLDIPSDKKTLHVLPLIKDGVIQGFHYRVKEGDGWKDGYSYFLPESVNEKDGMARYKQELKQLPLECQLYGGGMEVCSSCLESTCVECKESDTDKHPVKEQVKHLSPEMLFVPDCMCDPNGVYHYKDHLEEVRKECEMEGFELCEGCLNLKSECKECAISSK